jgi:hypothetical protein
MAIASLPLGALLSLTAMTNGMKPSWYGIVFACLIVLSGPFSLLGLGQHQVLPLLALSVCVYGLSIAWLFWKPSRWSKWVFVGLSVLWLLFGCGLASIGI